MMSLSLEGGALTVWRKGKVNSPSPVIILLTSLCLRDFAEDGVLLRDGEGLDGALVSEGRFNRFGELTGNGVDFDTSFEGEGVLTFGRAGLNSGAGLVMTGNNGMGDGAAMMLGAPVF